MKSLNDHLYAEMFKNPTVKVGGYQEYKKEIQEASQAIFGRILTPEDFVELMAAPDGSELLIEAHHYDEGLELKLGYKWFNGTHDYVIYVEEEKRIVQINNVYVKKDAPELLETLLFAQQVMSFQAFGINRIQLYAAGYPDDPSGYIGYYFWPRVGFVMYLGNVGAQLIEAGLAYASDTLELFSQPGGADWWYNHGKEGEAIFYLGRESPCVQALQVYLEEKGVNVNGES